MDCHASSKCKSLLLFDQIVQIVPQQFPNQIDIRADDCNSEI